MVMVLKVFAPVIVRAPALPWLRVQLKVEPPPTKVLAVAPVIEMVPVPVPAMVVNPVGLALKNALVVEAVHTRVPPLNVRLFVPAFVPKYPDKVSVLPLRSNPPVVSVNIAPPVVVRALVSWTPPTVWTSIYCVKDTPLPLTCCRPRPAKVIVPVPLSVTPVPFNQDPWI